MEPVKSGIKPGSPGTAFFLLPGYEIILKQQICGNNKI